MALELAQSAVPRPAAVAVHDDRDVPWQLGERDEEVDLGLGCGRIAGVSVSGRDVRDGRRVGWSSERYPAH